MSNFIYWAMSFVPDQPANVKKAEKMRLIL